MLNIGDKVYYFEIRLDFMKDAVTTKEKEFTVIGTNEIKFVMNDVSFTRIQYKDEKYAIDTPFKATRISRWNTKPYWDEVKGYIYTDNESKLIAHKAIRKELEKYLYENFGRYCIGIDLLKKFDEQ